jgi:hypothetical protein
MYAERLRFGALGSGEVRQEVRCDDATQHTLLALGWDSLGLALGGFFRHVGCTPSQHVYHGH